MQKRQNILQLKTEGVLMSWQKHKLRPSVRGIEDRREWKAYIRAQEE